MLKNQALSKRSIVVNSVFLFSLFSYYSRLDSCPVTDIKWVLSHIFYTLKYDCRERKKLFPFEYFNSLNPRHIKAFVTFSTSFVLFNWLIFYLLCSFIVGLSCWFYALDNSNLWVYFRFRWWNKIIWVCQWNINDCNWTI